MGAWDYTTLGNDGAQDLLTEFNKARDVSVLENALDTVSTLSETDYLEAPEAERAIASAELIKTITETELKAVDTLHLKQKAHSALSRILRNSELKELWAESPDYDNWVKSVEALF